MALFDGQALEGMNDVQWEFLLKRIRAGKCTPFLGAGVNSKPMPLGGEVAQRWALQSKYPFLSSSHLDQVAQYLAVQLDASEPKSRIIEELRDTPKPHFGKSSESTDCLRALAELPLPLYLTTNYDDLIVQALRAGTPSKTPVREFCRWTKFLKSLPPTLSPDYRPSVSNPLVFHMHGHDEEENSIVITEDDYIDFIVNLSRYDDTLPMCVRTPLSNTSLLFIGYALRDTTFRVIYRGLCEQMDKSQRRYSITVQLEPPAAADGRLDDAKRFMNEYFGKMEVGVFWGSATEFTQQLRDRWKRFNEATTQATA